MKRQRCFVSAWICILAVCGVLSAEPSVDGMPLHFSVHGKGPHTIILVHGWTCDETTWETQVPSLSKAYRVITLDLPGHGKSGSPKDGTFSMGLFARAVEAVRREVKADRVVVAGHSMGTPVVIQYARLYPQHTAALIFVDGLVFPPSNLPPVNPQQFAGPEGRKARENMVRGMFSSSTTPAMQTHILSMMLGAPEATALGAMKATFDGSNWKDDVTDLPVLGIYADHSRLGDREYMKTHYSKLRYVEIPNTGHFLMMEKPDEFNRLVSDFLKEQSF